MRSPLIRSLVPLLLIAAYPLQPALALETAGENLSVSRQHDSSLYEKPITMIHPAAYYTESTQAEQGKSAIGYETSIYRDQQGKRYMRVKDFMRPIAVSWRADNENSPDSGAGQSEQKKEIEESGGVAKEVKEDEPIPLRQGTARKPSSLPAIELQDRP